MLLQKKRYIFSILIISSILFSDDITRDCPENFILNPEYPASGPECYPTNFLFSLSSKQAFYYFNTITIDGFILDSEDWVAAFNGDICIGARNWDISQCNSGVCDVPVMGSDGGNYSLGYIESGQIPTFKIYDYSENIYYDALPSSQEPWYDLGLIFLDSLTVSTAIEGCTDELACNYNANADIENDSCEYNVDCLEECGGSAIIDECGICDGLGIIEGFCDCEGNILDDCNVCGGPGAVFDCGCQSIPDGFCDCFGNVLDECGICGGLGLNDIGCCGIETPDCLGNCGGNAILDQCEICDYDISNDCIQDCLGDWGGDAEYDNCGVCNINPNDNCIQDCAGDWGGSEVEDDCGICDGNNSSCNAPIAYNQNIITEEDSYINFLINANDPNNNELAVIILSNPIHGVLDIVQNLEVTYTPDNNYSGEDNILYKVTDGEWESDAAQITIIINESYDAPVVSDFTIDMIEDGLITIDLGAYDTDSNDDNLVFNIISSPAFGILEEQRAIASYLYTPNFNYNGVDEFIYEVTDGANASQAQVTINIINANDIPIALDFDFTELQIIDFSQFINDIDEDFLSIRTIPPSLGNNLITVFNNELIYAGTEYLYTYEPSEEFDILLYKVNDGLSESLAATAIYNNNSETFNREIPIALSDEIIMEENNETQISFFAFDYDGFLNGSPSIEVTDYPDYGILGEFSNPIISDVVAEWTASYIPNQNYSGIDQISFSITDDDNEGSLEDGLISITINPINNHPILYQIEDIQFDEDSSYIIDLSATDVDGDNLNFSISEGANIEAFLEEESIEFFSNENWHGLETFTISVFDGLLQTSQVITVVVNPINDAPVLVTDLTNIIIDEDSTILIDLYAYDIDSDVLIYSISGGNNISAYLNINPTSIQFSPLPNWNGSEIFGIYVNDGLLLDYLEVNVTVEPINDSPIILSTSQVEIDANFGYSYNIEAIDQDNDELSYNINGSPDGMVINGSLITWSNIPSNISYEEFLVSVTDGFTTVYENIELTIIQFYDCNGIINGPAILDCNEICEGISELDDCGICDSNSNNNNESCIGCTNLNACNYDFMALIDDGTCEFPPIPYDCSENCINDIDDDDICDELEIDGCTNPLAPNYNELATEDNGSCIDPECNQEFNLSDFDFHNFEFNGSMTGSVFISEEENGNINDLLISFVNDEIRGYSYGMIFPITGDTQFPIMLYSNQTSGEIITFKYYHASSNQIFCLDETIEFIDNMMIGDGLDPFIFNIQEEYVLGCTDGQACNYNMSANFDDGSCIYPDNYYDCTGNCFNDIDSDNICDEVDVCEGELNIDSDNDGICNDIDPCIGYDNIDDDDDGVCNDYDPCIGSDNIDIDNDGICNDQEIIGCMDIEACNYDSTATDAGDCYFNIDCEGICGGDSFIDDCGSCVPENTNPDDCLGSELSIPQNLYLSQNYPNPFNPLSTIEYGVPNRSHINISLYDLNGRIIETMVNSVHREGYYTLTLVSDNLNSGIYIVKIISSNESQTRKITIIK